MSGWLCEHRYVVKMAAVRILQGHIRTYLTKKRSFRTPRSRLSDIYYTPPQSFCLDSTLQVIPEVNNLEILDEKPEDVLETQECISEVIPSVLHHNCEDSGSSQHEVSLDRSDNLSAFEKDDTFDLLKTPRSVKKKNRRKVRMSVDMFMQGEDVQQMFIASCATKDHNQVETSVCNTAKTWWREIRHQNRQEQPADDKELQADDVEQVEVDVVNNSIELPNNRSFQNDSIEEEPSTDVLHLNKKCHVPFVMSSMFGLQRRIHMAGVFGTIVGQK